ncbi:hypothetical protein DERP_013627 [Dermatophagoides pteronyssinus]|uniref:Uncharacterized protein n=1 Tax=Dermatophagoides pteronyssinus TaxID=6956 RepID=A0ABQ8IPR8_DERPT|nr:hypothetical protein DERP_013627 [Dermatophagoides pteronyssinus]
MDPLCLLRYMYGQKKANEGKPEEKSGQKVVGRYCWLPSSFRFFLFSLPMMTLYIDRGLLFLAVSAWSIVRLVDDVGGCVSNRATSVVANKWKIKSSNK